jgi:RHS repeat-associated protein
VLDLPDAVQAGHEGRDVHPHRHRQFGLTGPAGNCLPLAIQADPNNVTTIKLTGGSNDTMSGIVYARSGSLVLTGSGSLFTLAAQVVVGTVTLTGSGNITVDAAGSIPCSLTLAPVTAGPNLVGTSQQLTATLKTNDGTPVAGHAIALDVEGANSIASSATTDASGNATFGYTGGAAGTDVATASIAVGTATLRSNTSTITWVESPLRGATLTLAPATAGPDTIGTSQELDATLTSAGGSPIAGQTVSLTITGANPTTVDATTDASGVAKFTYTGANEGTDTAQATAADAVVTVRSNTSTVTWVRSLGPQIPPVTSTGVDGNFYAEPTSATTFAARPGDTPAFGQSFPNIAFDPPAGTIQYTPAGVDPGTRPFTDVVLNAAGTFAGTSVAQGNGVQAGVGALSSFDAVFTAEFNVKEAGDVTLSIIADDGFMLGVGGGASRVSGAYENPPASNTSPFQGYPLMAAYNVGGASGPGTYTATIHFPAAGTYPYELDYFECCGSKLSLVLSTATVNPATEPLSVYVGYADGLRPAGSIFPFPWLGSPNVVFEGCHPGCTFDGGAIRVDNSSDTDVTVDSLSADFGSCHFAIWPQNQILPAGQIMIFAQEANGASSGCDNRSGQFDTSDLPFAGFCGQNGIIPAVNLTVDGIAKTYTDSGQVLDTGGEDVADCLNRNESESWQRVGGGGTPINTPLPPAVSLAISPATVAVDTVGQPQTFTVSALDASGEPVAGLPVMLGVFGQNAGRAPDAASTDADGNVTFSYVGLDAGTDTVTATAFVSGLRVASNAVAVTWSIPGGGTPEQAPPAITDVGPADGSVVTAPTPITAAIDPPDGETIASWQVTYRAVDGGSPVVIAHGTGAPPSPIATFDPTVVADGTYVLTVSATASGGGTQTLTTTVAVSGNLKPGRFVSTYQDLSVPVNGFQIDVRRTYDSFDKRAGDFGVGWHVSLGNFGTSANRALGAGGWTEFVRGCGLFCWQWQYATSAPHFVTVTWPDGHQEDFDFTPIGQVDALVDFAVGTAAFTARPGTGTTSTLAVTNDAEKNFEYRFDGSLYGADGNVYDPTRYTLTARDGRVFVLDTQTGLVSETDPNGNSLTVDSGGVHSTLGPASAPTPGPSITFSRDAQGRITDIDGPVAGQHLHYAYAGGELQSFTDANGNTDTYGYDPTTGNLASVSGPGGRPLQTLQYDADGRLTSVAHGDEPPTEVSTSVADRQETLLDPSGKLTTVLSFDELGDVVERDQVFGGKTLKTTYTYDPVGRLTSITDPLHHVWSQTYDESTGDVLTTTDGAGRTWQLENYNAFGEPGDVRRPDGTVLTYLTYDPNTGALLSDHAPGAAPTTRTYTPSGQLETVTDPGGRTLRYGYDANGHLGTISDGSGRTIHLTIDAAGRLTGVEDQLGAVTQLEYTPGGQLAQLIDPNHNSYRYFYDPLGRLHQVEDPLSHSTFYEYNAVGEVVKRTDRNGDVTTFDYDADGRLTHEVRPGNDALDFSYDPLGRLIGAEDAAGHVDRTYTDTGRVASETTCGATGSATTPCGAVASPTQPVVTLAYTYAPDDQLESVSSPDTGTVRYGYDGDGRLATVQDPANGVFGFGYDPRGLLATLTRPNQVDDSFTWTASGDLQSRDATHNGATVAPFDYQLDPDTGQVTALTDSLGTHHFTYYGNGALKTATHPAGSGLADETYAYDAAGNRTSGTGIVGTATYDAADRLRSDGNFDYAYDAEGDLVSKTPTGGGAPTTYSWNAEHQLTAIHYPDGSTSTYSYDPLGRRIRVTRGGADTRFVYNGLNPQADYDSGNHLLTGYVTGVGIDSALESVSGDSPSYYLSDGLGSVRASTDANGSITGTYAYDSYGRPAAGNASPSRFTFTGDQYDAASGLYDANARYYDPATGRFASEDPVQHVDPYTYANDDPIDYVDPTGAQAFIEYQALLRRDIEAAPGLAKINACLGLGVVIGLTTGNAEAAQAIALRGFATGFKEFFEAEIGPLGPAFDVMLGNLDVKNGVDIAGAINEFFDALGGEGSAASKLTPFFDAFDDYQLIQSYLDYFRSLDPNASPAEIATYCGG